jgi:hypothetical protein
MKIICEVKLTEERSIESMDRELAYSPRFGGSRCRPAAPGSKVVLGESCGVAAVWVMTGAGGWLDCCCSI